MEYFEPNFIDEALVVLDRFGNGARVLAGGTLLGSQLRRDPDAASALVNLKRIRALTTIKFDGETLGVGSLATAAALSADELVKMHAPLLARAAATVGAPALRSVATIGGNLLCGHHAADLAVALLACDATATIATPKEGTVELPVERMLAPGFEGLGTGALVTELSMRSMAGRRHAFEKVQRRAAFEMAVVSAGVVLDADGDVVRSVRIALGGAAPTPIRAVAAEASLAGATLHEGAIAHAGQVAANVDAEPVGDARAGSPYRRHLANVLVARALRTAWRAELSR